MVDLLYASSRDADMRYALKSEVSDPIFFLATGNKKYAFLDYREIDIFRTERGHEDVEAVLSNPLLEELRNSPAFAEASAGKGGEAGLALRILEHYAKEEKEVSVPRSFPLDLAEALREKGFDVKVRHPFYPDRAKKSPTEVEAIKETVRRTGAAFARIEEILRASEISNDRVLWQGEMLTSEILKAEAEMALIREGLADVEGMIVACEAHSAIPHHRGEGPIVPHEPIVCDIFPRDRKTGYFADVTRTYVKGKPSAEVQKMYDAVLATHTRCIEAVRPGVPAKEIHALASGTLEEAGFTTQNGRGFIHGTGHGVGLEIHEAPSVGASSRDVLEPGHVITIEPGLYYPEHGGIRIEDVVLVTEDSCENLARIPKVFVVS